MTMAIDEVPQQGQSSAYSSEPGGGPRFTVIFIILGVLVLGEIYTLSQIGSLRGSLNTQQDKMRKELHADLDQQLSERFTALANSKANSNAARLEEFKQELDVAAKRVGSSGRELRQARDIVTRLQEEQKREAERLQQELARKADQEQLGTLTQGVSATRSELESTKKSLESLRSDLGMARSELGTLIARNHDEIEKLRQIGERDYFEFTLVRRQLQRVAGVGLLLKKTNVKRHRFNLSLIVDDKDIEKKDRTINEPIFFTMQGSKKFYELVVNDVQSNQVRGYMSAPKGMVEVAARSGGA